MKIVAEIGSNHGGKLEGAIEHLEAASSCGCNGVKYQFFQPELLDSRENVQTELTRYVLKPEWIPELRERSHKAGMEFICTPFDTEACKRLEGQVDMVKVSAYDLTYDNLVRGAAELGVPIILSTAMATWEEIGHALDVVEEGRQKRGRRGVRGGTTLLHGVAQYPAQLGDMNLKVLRTMQEIFPWCEVGISDHTLGWEAAILSVALGGTMVEKHMKVDGRVEGPDVRHSMTAQEMGELVMYVRRAERAMGEGEKEGPLPCEQELFESCRRSDKKPLRRTPGEGQRARRAGDGKV